MNRRTVLVWMALCALLLVGLSPVAKAQDDAAAAALPRAETPVKSATIETREGRPTVVLNGVDAMPFVAYCNAILSPPNWAKWNEDFAALDVDVFFLSVTPWMQVYEAAWSDEGMAAYVPGQDPKPLSLEAQVAAILAMKPDARFVVRWGVTPGKAWQEAHPDELQLAEGGKRYPEASLGSALFRTDLVAFMKRLVGHIEAQPWAERVISYVVFPLGEGITPLTIDGYFYDRSPAMLRAWGEWLDGRTTLATGDEMENIDPPLFEPGKVPRDAFPSEAEVRDWLADTPVFDAPPRHPPVREYVRMQRELMAQWTYAILNGLNEATKGRDVLTGLDALKLPMLGWQLRESFEAVDHGPQLYDIIGVSGPAYTDMVLDHPGLDVLVTPADYHARGVGMGWDGEGLGDPLVLRGKTLIIENDARTWLATEARGRAPLGAFMTPQEVRAGLLRNTGMAMSRGFMHYWMDISNGFFRDPQVQAGVATDRDALRTLSALPHRETEHAIAVIIDDEAILDTNFTSGFHNLAIIRQRIDALAISGIPYRVHLLRDLAREDFPNYRCWYFPNLLRLQGSIRTWSNDAEWGEAMEADITVLLRQKVLRDGNIAIFGPGTGIADALTAARAAELSGAAPLSGTDTRRARVLPAEAAEALLGIPMAVFPGSAPRRVRLTDRGHPALQATGVPPIYGDSYPFGPILLPDRERFPDFDLHSGSAADGRGLHKPHILGEGQITWRANAPGLVLREFGRGARDSGIVGDRGPDDYAVVFSAALPIPGPVLRGLARYGGCKVWCDADVVLSASDSMVSLHSTEPGPFTLHLPRRVPEVRDALTGELIARNVETLVITLSPPETRIFTLSPSPPAAAD